MWIHAFTWKKDLQKHAFQIMTISEWYRFLQLSWTISLLEICWDIYLAYFSLSLTNFFLEIRAIIITPWKIVFFNFQWYILTSLTWTLMELISFSTLLSLNLFVKFLLHSPNALISIPNLPAQNKIVTSNTRFSVLFYRFLTCEANPSWICKRLRILRVQELNLRMYKNSFSKKMHFNKIILTSICKIIGYLVKIFSNN